MILMSNINENLDYIGTIEDISEEKKEYMELELLLTEELYNENQKKIEDLQKKEEKNKNDILLILLGLIKGVELTDDLLNVDKTTANKLIKNINKEIDKICNNEIISEKSNINNILNEVIDYSYDFNNYLMSEGNSDYKTTKLNNKIKKDILNEKINKKTHEDRITDNKKNLFKNIKEDINNFIMGIVTLDLLKRKINVNLDINKFNTDRLIIDQISRKISQAKKQWSKDNNSDKKAWISILCSTTCDTCKSLHGKIFDSSFNDFEPPLHIYCKCYWYYLPKEYTDLKGKDISWENFLEWEGEDK